MEAATQTFATITLQNYFRMYHKLAGMTGTAETEAGEFWSIYKLDVVVIPTNRPVIRDDRDDKIYKTKKAKYAAVISRVSELTKEGRPVLGGTTDVETTELLSRMLKFSGIKHNVLNAKEHAREAEIVAQAGQTSSVTIATNRAGRGTDIKLSPEVRTAGGLAIVGTERHDSRRVDRQLRGRAGRQGDPGSSEFYVSLEDKLMRLFGSERIAGVVDKLGMQDDEALESGMLSSSIEKAQRKVEENNSASASVCLNMTMMNYQREAVCPPRNAFPEKDRNRCQEYDDRYRFTHRGQGGRDVVRGFEASVMASFPLTWASRPRNANAKGNVIADSLFVHMQEVYRRRMDGLSEKVYPILKQVYEKQGSLYQNIAIPISDGRKMLTLSVNLEKAYNTEGKEIAKALSRSIILYQIDEHWKQHLRDMDDLRQSVQNAAYEQKDPLVVYKLESYNLFAAMLEELNRMCFPSCSGLSSRQV